MSDIQSSDMCKVVKREQAITDVAWRTVVSCIMVPFKITNRIVCRYSTWVLMSLQRYTLLVQPKLNVERLNKGGLNAICEALIYDWKNIEFHIEPTNRGWFVLFGCLFRFVLPFFIVGGLFVLFSFILRQVDYSLVCIIVLVLRILLLCLILVSTVYLVRFACKYFTKI